MKTFALPLLSILFVTACVQQPNPEVKEVGIPSLTTELPVSENITEASFSISGMMCKMGCAATIEKNLSKLEGVQKASVDFETTRATVFFDPTILQSESLVEAVKNIGDDYKVSGMKTQATAEKSCCEKEGCKAEKCKNKKG